MSASRRSRKRTSPRISDQSKCPSSSFMARTIRSCRSLIGRATAKLAKNGTLKVYEKLPHGMATTHAERINADLLAFIKG